MNICAATRAAKVRSAKTSTTASSPCNPFLPASRRRAHPGRILRRRPLRSRPKAKQARRRRSPERMDMSSNPLTPDARAVERLPYAFAAALALAYERGASHAADIVTDLDANPDLAALAESLPKVADLLESEDDAPIVRLINALFSQAVRENASDIHIEAFEGRSVVRFRRDGMLREVVRQPHGIILVTGPTGSGKTTTLYAALGQLDAKRTNIVTVEDPIEYDLDGVGQTQVNPRIELTFARALRAILRQDPDVVMIGEIRDLETAQIAVQASLTGHLVLATLHTNDAAGAVVRLVDMGIEPFLVASSLLGVRAQRLVRRLCPACRKCHPRAAAERRLLQGANGGKAVTELFGASGCDACSLTGYPSRTGIFELLLVDDESRRLIHDRASEAELLAHARANGMKGLREDGIRWVQAGETSLEEVLRVSRD